MCSHCIQCNIINDSPDFSDVNECRLEIDNCHRNATCMNTYGSFSCSCDADFFGDGVTCFSKIVYNCMNHCYAEFDYLF